MFCPIKFAWSGLAYGKGRPVATKGTCRGRPDDVRSCDGFRMTADRDCAACTGAVVRKPPKHEVAGSWAAAEQRALWGLYVGGDLDDGRDASTRRRPCPHAGEARRVQWASRRARGVHHRAVGGLMNGIGSRGGRPHGRMATGLSAPAPAQRAGAQRLRAISADLAPLAHRQTAFDELVRVSTLWFPAECRDFAPQH